MQQQMQQQQQQQAGMPIRGGSVDMNRGRGLRHQHVALCSSMFNYTQP